MSNEFNPQSNDAMFARVLQMLEDQKESLAKKAEDDKAAFSAMLGKQDLTNGRVKALEVWRANFIGRIAGISASVSAGVALIGLIIHWMSNK